VLDDVNENEDTYEQFVVDQLSRPVEMTPGTWTVSTCYEANARYHDYRVVCG
jgi:hypothetical protein